MVCEVSSKRQVKKSFKEEGSLAMSNDAYRSSYMRN